MKMCSSLAVVVCLSAYVNIHLLKLAINGLLDVDLSCLSSSNLGSMHELSKLHGNKDNSYSGFVIIFLPYSFGLFYFYIFGGTHNGIA